MADGLKSLNISAAFAVVLAIVVLTGMVFTAQFSQILRTTTAQENATATLLINTSVLVASPGTYPFLQTATPCINATGTKEPLAEADYDISTGGTAGGFILLNNLTWNGTSVGCNITYLADSTAQGIADLFTAGLAIFGTFMAIIVLAIVGKIIIGLFKKK